MSRVIVIVAVLYFVLYIYFFAVHFSVPLEVKLIAFVLKSIGAKIIVESRAIIIIGKNILTLIVYPECSGLSTILVYIAIIGLTPYLSLSKKIYYGTIGGLTLLLINIQRIVITGAIGVIYGEDVMILWHDVVSPLLMLFAIYALWGWWVFSELSESLRMHCQDT